VAVTVIGNAEATSGSSEVTSLAVSVPTHADGDLLVALIAQGENEDGVTDHHKDWTRQPGGRYISGGSPPSVPELLIQTRIASSEPASYTWTCSTSSLMVGQIIAIRGYDPDSGVHGIAQIAENPQGSGDPVSPSVTTVYSNEAILRVALIDDDEVPGTESNIAPGSTTFIQATMSNGGTFGADVSLASAIEIQASPGASATRTWNPNSSEENNGISIRIPEARISVSSVTASPQAADTWIAQGASTVAAGSLFGATQGAGTVELASSSNYAAATKVTQTVTSWSASSITFTANRGAIAQGRMYVFVTDNGGNRSAAKRVIVVDTRPRVAAVHRRVALNTSTGLQTITATNNTLGGRTPKGVLVLGITRTGTAGGLTDNLSVCRGFASATGPAQAACAMRSVDAVGTTQVHSRGASDELIMLLQTGSGTAGAVAVEANLDAFVPDGIRINIGATNGVAYLVDFLFFAGEELEIQAGIATVPGRGNVSSVALSIGDPDVLFMAGAGGQLNDSAITGASYTFGGARLRTRLGAATEQAMLCHTIPSGVTTTAPVSAADSGFVAGVSSASGAQWKVKAEPERDAGFRLVNHQDTPGTVQVAYLAIRWPGARTEFGFVSSPTGTGIVDRNIGWRPHCILFGGSRVQTVGTLEQDVDAGPQSLSYVAANDREPAVIGCVQVNSEDGQSTSNEQQEHLLQHVLRCRTVSTDLGALMVNYSDTGYAISWQFVLAAGRAQLHCVIENVSGALLAQVHGETVELDETRLAARELSRQRSEELSPDETRAGVRALIRQISEAVDVAESIARASGLIRAAGDAVTLAEVPGRARTMARTRDGSVTAEQDVLRVRTMARLAGESITADETSARMRALSRAVDEPEQIAEDVAHIRAICKAVSEALELGETLARIRALARAVSESQSISESAVRARALARAVQELEQLAQTHAAARTLIRSISELVQLTESAAKLRGLVRAVDETERILEDVVQAGVAKIVQVIDEALQLLEDSVSVRGLVRVLADVIESSEGAVRALGLVRAHGELVQVAQTLAAIRGLVRATDELENALEDAERVRTLARAVDETERLAQSVARMFALVRVADEALQVLGSALQVRGLVRAADEALQLSESTSRVRGLLRFRDEQLSVAETIARLRSAVRAIDELVQLADAQVRARTLARALSEVVQVLESADLLRGRMRQHSEPVQIVEQALRVTGLRKAVSETVQLAETLARRVGLIRAVGALVTLIEGAVRTRTLARLSDELVQRGESTRAPRDLSRAVSALVQLTESARHALGLLKSVDEAEQLPESATHSRGLLRAVTHAVQIVHSSAHALGLVRIAEDLVRSIEVATRSRALARVHTELESLLDEAVRVRGIVRVAEDLVSVLESQLDALGTVGKLIGRAIIRAAVSASAIFGAGTVSGRVRMGQSAVRGTVRIDEP